ncbi:MAG TPA: energy transducer TonB [Steroidobacteraceae bacterium]|nr:energy transducer TonB [Steroidobacteraceae bacterium]
MSTPALALPRARVSRRQRLRRRHALNRIPLQWHDVPVAQSPGLIGGRAVTPRYWVLGVVALALVGLHFAAAWYADRVARIDAVKPQKNSLAIELVRPPEPEPPKTEPPPPKTPPKAPPKAPPPIQTAAVVPSDAPVAAPVETLAAVAPAELAPPPPPAPVKPAFGGIGYKNNPEPDYPAQAVRQGWQGTVILRVRVLANGAADSIEVLKTSGKKLLDDAAIATVQRWSFAPSTRGGEPIEGFATVPIEFKLDT